MRLPVLLIIFSYLILILTDVYILNDINRNAFTTGKKSGKGKSIWWKLYSGFAIAILAVLTVAICLPRRSASGDITAIMWLLYIVITVSLTQIVYVIISCIGYIPRIFGIKKRNYGAFVGMFLALVVFIAMWWGALIGRKQIDVERVAITSSKLPESFRGYKIAQISDLHVGTWGNDTTFISNLVDSINNLHPDLIVFTGDIVNRESSELKPFVKTLSRLKARDGVYSVLGNHDYGDYISWNSGVEKRQNMENLKRMQKDMGWTLLDNTHTSLKGKEGADSIILIGVGNWGEPPFAKYGNIKTAYPGDLNDGNFKILLSHNPEHWNQEISKISNIDLTLSGHTHAMQIMLKAGDWRWSPSKMKYQQWGGLYEREKSKLYVNIGAGEVGFPMRVGATPEITLFTLDEPGNNSNRK